MSEKLHEVLVIKVGTSSLVDVDERGRERLDAVSFRRIGQQVVELYEDGVEVVLVSSGAVAAAMIRKGMRRRPDWKTEGPLLSALSGAGWGAVVSEWEEALAPRGVSPMLLTQTGLSAYHDRLAVPRTIRGSLMLGDVPLVNANDALSYHGSGLQCNDQLAATLAVTLKRSPQFSDDVGLMLLTDVDGIYAAPGNPSSRLEVLYSTDEFASIARGDSGHHGTGGIDGRLQALATGVRAGIPGYVADARRPGVVREVLQGLTGTRIVVSDTATADMS